MAKIIDNLDIIQIIIVICLKPLAEKVESLHVTFREETNISTATQRGQTSLSRENQTDCSVVWIRMVVTEMGVQIGGFF